MAQMAVLRHAPSVAQQFVDLHCHWVCGIDDGARSFDESAALLSALNEIGFDTVFATPHMRPGMFENSASDIRRAYRECVEYLRHRCPPLATALACEHYFDDVVFERILNDQGLPYPGGRAILLECYALDLSAWWLKPFATLIHRGIRPIVAHPERYRALWNEPSKWATFRDAGAIALLDLGALVGYYGERSRRCAQHLLELDLYDAACSDAHRMEDIDAIHQGITLLEEQFGFDRVQRLLCDGPRQLLAQGLPEVSG